MFYCNLNYIFAGVHDSYWTHACDVDEMNRILREKFVELYERPILEKVSYLFSVSLNLKLARQFFFFHFVCEEDIICRLHVNFGQASAREKKKNLFGQAPARANKIIYIYI